MTLRKDEDNLWEDPALWHEHSAYAGSLAAQMQADPKKQGKEKKPDENLVSLIFLNT
jgi:hypothetical protein